MIATIIRKKELQLRLNEQALQQARLTLDELQQSFKQMEAHVESVRRQLIQQLRAGRALIVHELAMIQAQETQWTKRLHNARSALRQQQEAADVLAQRVAHGRKELEKLNEIALEKKQERLEIRQRREWTDLDELAVLRTEKRA